LISSGRSRPLEMEEGECGLCRRDFRVESMIAIAETQGRQNIGRLCQGCIEHFGRVNPEVFSRGVLGRAAELPGADMGHRGRGGARRGRRRLRLRLLLRLEVSGLTAPEYLSGRALVGAPASRFTHNIGGWMNIS
jgi:hypothetical protein